MTTELRLALTDLEGHDWGPPSFQSHLVTECHRLRKRPLRDFTVEDLRIMIGQNIGLRYLVPLAITRLNEQPLAEGSYFPGDLLCNVLRVEPNYWKQYPKQRQQVTEISDHAVRALDHLDEERQGSRAYIEEGLAVFRRNG